MIKKKEKVLPKQKRASLVGQGTASSVDLTKELIEELLERGKREGALAYEEIIELGHKHHLSERDTEELLKLFEKENIDLVTQEELDGAEVSSADDEEPETAAHRRTFDNSIEEDGADYSDEEEVEDDDVRQVSGSTQLTDSVKSYLRILVKFPYLTKKPNLLLHKKIADGKRESIEAISKFAFVQKELAQIGERVKRDQMHLKGIIQFSEFDEDNLPKFEEEKTAFLATISQMDQFAF
jgi:hypothetical protein